MKKKKGSLISFSTGMFAIILSILIVLFAFTLYSINAQSEIVKDCLTSTNLAVFKELDLKVLGEDEKTIIISKPFEALNTYKKHLKNNLQLDNNYKSKNQISFIKDKVKIVKFKIYNVKNNDVEIYDVNPDTGSYTLNKIVGGKGKIKTERGNIVNETTVHSQISFNIDTMFGKEQNVTPSEDSDITKS